MWAVEPWAALAITAAIAQTTRNALAQSLSSRISPALNSWSRFAFCLPFAAGACLLSVAFSGRPTLPLGFFALCLLTALTQLLGNVALVAAFRAGSFGEAIVFHKLEVVLTAIAGAIFFAEHPSSIGILGILVCGVGVIAINLARQGEGDRWRRALHLGRSGSLALLCASLLVAASFALKEASRLVADTNPTIAAGDLAAAVQTLFHTTWIEVLALGLWIAWREPAGFAALRRHWRRMSLIGSTSFAASLCWFWAFSLALVAYVKAVGQIEVLLAVILGIRLLGERSLIRQLPGVLLVMVGIGLVLLG